MKDGSPVSNSQTADPPASLYWRLGVPLGLVVLIALAFVPALDASFVGWDDTDLVVGNTRYRGLTPETLRWVFTTSFGGHFQPLTWLSYSLDWAMWHREAFGFHLTNVLLHVLTALAFYGLARRLLVLGSPVAATVRSRSIILGAGMAAALFAVHPLRAESVAWIAERRDVLSGVLYVLAVSFYVRYAAGSVSSSRAVGFGPRAWYLLAIGSCALSLLAKASAITLPLVLLVLDVYPLRRLGRATNASAGRVLVEKLPFLLMAFLAGSRALVAQQDGGALYTLAAHDIPARLAQMCYGLVFYLRKTLWPTDLGPLYQIPPRDVLLGPMLWINLAVVLAIAATAVRLRRRVPALLAALSAYVVVVLPVLGVAQSGPQLVADRYSYLSCMGFALLVGGFVAKRSRSIRATGRARGPRLVLASAVVITLLARATFQQANVWTSGLTLWARGVHVSPDSAVAHTNYGDALARVTLFPAAMNHFRRALELDPRDAVAHHHLGDIEIRRGDPNAAIYHYAHSLSIDPTRTGACFSLGRALVAVGQAERALTVLRDGTRRSPDALDLIDYLARILSTHPADTIRSADEAVSLALHVNEARGPEHVPSLMTLATAYANAGRFDDAVSTGEEALRAADPTNDARLVQELKRRIEMFRRGEPYRTPW